MSQVTRPTFGKPSERSKKDFAMSDQRYQQIHEEMTDAYLELHPEMSWDCAYERVAVLAYEKWLESHEEQ